MVVLNHQGLGFLQKNPKQLWRNKEVYDTSFQTLKIAKITKEKEACSQVDRFW